jgi:hypothetical protein
MSISQIRKIRAGNARAKKKIIPWLHNRFSPARGREQDTHADRNHMREELSDS